MRTPTLIPRSLSERDRRAFVIGGLITAAALFFVFGVKPYVRALRETRDELAEQTALLARERSLLGSSAKFANSLEQAQTTLDQQNAVLFDGPDEVSATSDLSDKISEAAARSNVLVQQLETRKAEELPNGLAALSIDIRAEGDFEGVLHFLNALERSDKLIRVSAISLTRSDRSAGNPDQQGEVLAVNGTITGYGNSSLGDEPPAKDTNGRTP
jgi:type II secretory pathway component PulM